MYKHPPHVQRLLDTLSPQQRVFQERCIQFAHVAQLTLGFWALLGSIGAALALTQGLEPSPKWMSDLINESGPIVISSGCVLTAGIGTLLLATANVR